MTKTERIRRLRRDSPHLTSTEVAAQLACHPSFVRTIWNEMRTGQQTRHRASASISTAIKSDPDALLAARRAARSRGCKVRRGIVPDYRESWSSAGLAVIEAKRQAVT